MAKQILIKGSEEFEMFRDYWTLIQENWITEEVDGYWEKVSNDSDSFYKKYNTQFAKDLAVAYVNELERRYKNGR